MPVASTAGGWQVTPPAYRVDITIEADLIEEVARIVGFDVIPETDAQGPQRFRRLPGNRPAEPAVLQALADGACADLLDGVDFRRTDAADGQLA